MTPFSAAPALVAMLLGAASGCALARGGHASRGGHNGHFHTRHARTAVFATAAAPWYFLPSGYYFYPTEPSLPVEYIEKNSVSSGPAQPLSYWYYCSDSKAYYPEVQNCAGGWRELVSQPAP